MKLLIKKTYLAISALSDQIQKFEFLSGVRSFFQIHMPAQTLISHCSSLDLKAERKKIFTL